MTSSSDLALVEASSGIDDFKQQLGQQQSALENLDDKYSGQKGVAPRRSRRSRRNFPVAS